MFVSVKDVSTNYCNFSRLQVLKVRRLRFRILKKWVAESLQRKTTNQSIQILHGTKVVFMKI